MEGVMGGLGRKPLVLLVDDDAFTRAARAIDLRKEGFEVVEAATGLAAIALLADTAIDIVLADLTLDDRSALDRWVEANSPATCMAWTIRAHKSEAPALH
jgi:CheY-like chemotaxis protein